MKKLDLLGQRFGKLLVLHEVTEDKSRDIYWNCACDCGQTVRVSTSKLRSGRTTSCSCSWRKANHGMSYSPTWNAWQSILKRCVDGRAPKTAPYYRNKGIRICTEWLAFEKFYADMGEKPGPQYSIDRIDNEKGYEPGNCRWATAAVQSNNRSSVHHVKYQGSEWTLSDLASHLGVKRTTLYARYRNNGWAEGSWANGRL